MIEIKNLRGNWCVIAGKSILGKFSSESKARKSLNEDIDLYRYWAQSAGVSIENTPARVEMKLEAYCPGRFDGQYL